MLNRRVRCLGAPAIALLVLCGWWSTPAAASLAPALSASSSARSGNRVAQADLEAALIAAKEQYRQLHSFAQAGPPELEQYDPRLTWLGPDADAAPTGHQVGVSNGGDNANQTVTLAAVSPAGTCWFLVDVARSDSETLSGNSGIRSAGVWYGHENDAASVCNAPDNGPPMASFLSRGWSRRRF